MRFRKKPVEIEAMQLTDTNVDDLEQWIEAGGCKTTPASRHGSIHIETLEGTMRADTGDWIIRGVQGEFYPCKPDIFDASYDKVEN